MSLERPRFRRDLEARPVFADGQDCVDVSDHITGKAFRFYDFEYQVALAFDGLALDKVIPWVKLATGLALQVDQLREFARRLDDLGFLEHGFESAPGSKTESQVPGGDEHSQSSEAQGQDRSTDEPEAPGPPAPELVVMRPGEVVGETPPPVSIARAFKASDGEAPRGREAESSLDEGKPAEADRLGAASLDGERPGGVDKPAPIPPPTDAPTTEAEPPDEKSRMPAEVARPDSQPLDSQPPTSEGAEVAADAGSANLSAFPVLPVARSATASASVAAAPPPWSTPRPLMTPAPSTLGPSSSGDRSSARRRIRRTLVVFGTLGVLAAAALLAMALPFLMLSRRSQPIAVRTVSATPGAVYRYFEGGGIVAEMPGVSLKFPAGGKVTRIAATGVAVSVGDVVAAVEAAGPLLDGLARQRERLAYYRQMVEAMHQVGNAKEEERQLAKLESRNARIAQTMSELAQLAVIASSAGEVEETFAREGQAVEAGSPAARLRSGGHCATFELARPLVAAARRLGFCQVEVEGYVFDCSPLQNAGDDAHVTVALPSIPPALVGKMAHLARARYRNAVVLPTGALQTSGSRTGVFVISPGARLEARPVVIADRDAAEAIVIQGLDAGEKVVVEQGPGLRAGALVESRP